MVNDLTLGNVSWEEARMFVISELRRGIENDGKTVEALDRIKESITVADEARVTMLDDLKEVKTILKDQNVKMDVQQVMINSMRTKWAIVMAIGVVIVFLIEHIGIPLLFPSLRH